jgi:hypothetical protein
LSACDRPGGIVALELLQPRDEAHAALAVGCQLVVALRRHRGHHAGVAHEVGDHAPDILVGRLDAHRQVGRVLTASARSMPGERRLELR